MLIIPNLPRICNHPTWILRIFFINRMLKLGFWNRHWIIDSNCGPHRMYVVDLKQAFWWPYSKVDCIRLSDVSWWLSILLFFLPFRWSKLYFAWLAHICFGGKPSSWTIIYPDIGCSSTLHLSSNLIVSNAMAWFLDATVYAPHSSNELTHCLSILIISIPFLSSWTRPTRSFQSVWYASRNLQL